MVGSGNQQVAWAQNQLYCGPLWIPQNSVIDQLAFEVTIAAAGSTARAGIYTNRVGVILGPDRLLAETADLAVASTGVRVGALAAPLTLQPGLYWLGLLALGAVTASYRRATQDTTIPIFGFSAALGFATLFTDLFVATPGGPLPDPFPFASGVVSSQRIYVAARFAG